jgi:hypothetical protein
LMMKKSIFKIVVSTLHEISSCHWDNPFCISKLKVNQLWFHLKICAKWTWSWQKDESRSQLRLRKDGDIEQRMERDPSYRKQRISLYSIMERERVRQNNCFQCLFIWPKDTLILHKISLESKKEVKSQIMRRKLCNSPGERL